VITSPITFPATANVVLHLGATPVFVDVEQETLNLDASLLEEAITPRTKAIIPVHMAGLPCDMDRIAEVAQRHDLVVVEDAAHALGAEYRGRRVGTLSPFSCFSFYPIKNITTGEGGLVTMSREEDAERVRLLSLHGMSRDAWKRYGAEGTPHWETVLCGYKYNMTDLQASIGIHQLDRLEGFLEQRARYAALYRDRLAELEGIELLPVPTGVRHANHLFVVLVRRERLRLDRDGFAAALRRDNIGTGIHFRSLHLHPLYRDRFGFQADDFPVANALSDRILSLPLYPKMTEEQVQSVISAVRRIVQHYRV
jgi:dTDP-4-amino-4,6-dideoxygalactose transaminase